MRTGALSLIVTCARPGLIRAGAARPACADHPLDAFTEAQLQELLREPAISVVVGRQLLPEHLADFFAETEAAGRTRVVGSTVDTDAGASMVTDVLAQRETLRQEVEKVEAAAAHTYKDATPGSLTTSAAAPEGNGAAAEVAVGVEQAPRGRARR